MSFAEVYIYIYTADASAGKCVFVSLRIPDTYDTYSPTRNIEGELKLDIYIYIKVYSVECLGAITNRARFALRINPHFFFLFGGWQIRGRYGRRCTHTHIHRGGELTWTRDISNAAPLAYAANLRTDLSYGDEIGYPRRIFPKSIRIQHRL